MKYTITKITHIPTPITTSVTSLSEFDVGANCSNEYEIFEFGSHTTDKIQSLIVVSLYKYSQSPTQKSFLFISW